MVLPLLGAAKGALTKPKKQEVKIDPVKFSGKVDGSKAKVKGKSRPTTVKPVAPKVVNINVEREKKTVVTGQDPLVKQVELTYVRTIQIQQLLRDRAKQKQKDEKKKLNWFQRLFRKNREEARENVALKVLGGLGGGVIKKGKGLLESIMGIIGTLFGGWLLQFIPQIVQAIKTGLEWLGKIGDALKPFVTPVWNALKWMAGAAAKFLVDPDVLEKDSNSFLKNLNILDQRLGVIKKAFDLVVAASLFSAGMQIFKSVGGILGGMWELFKNFRKLWKRIFPKSKFNLKNVKKPNYRQLKLDLSKATPKKPNVLKRTWDSIVKRTKNLNLKPKKGSIAGKISQFLKSIKIPIPKWVTGAKGNAFINTILAGFEFKRRKEEGQSTTQAVTGTAGSTAGGFAGFWAGSKVGAVAGGGIGAMFAGVGAAPGALIGGIIGGIAGSMGGSWLGGKAMDKMFEPVSTGNEVGDVGKKNTTLDLKSTDTGNVRKDEFRKRRNELILKKRYGGTGRPITVGDKTYNPGDEGYRDAFNMIRGDVSKSKLNDSNLIGHSAMYDKPAEVEFIPFPVPSGGSESGESGSSGDFSLDLGADVYDVAALNREASNLAKVWA